MNRKQSILFLLTLASLSANAQTARSFAEKWHRDNRRNEVPDSVNFFPKMGRYFSAYSLRHRSAERADAPSFNDTDETSLNYA